MTIETELKRTPLYQEHVKLNAKMVPFGGWEMPVQYEGILAEYHATREAAAIFDISHMGEFEIEGDYKKSGLDKILTMKLDDIKINSSRYGCILNDQGCVIDDCIIFRIEEEKWFLVVNGATTDKDEEHIRRHLTEETQFKNVSQELGKIDIQGPEARNVLKKHVKGIEKLNYFHFDFFNLLGQNVLISRTGYTGELGYEIFYPWDKTIDLWNVLLDDEKVKPAGLGARDVLRLEVGYCLYGHELNDELTPLHAGLSRFIDFEKEFIGKEALLTQRDEGINQKLVGIISENRRSPREGYKIYSDSEEVGFITSGTFSPILNKGIGVGYIRHTQLGLGTPISFGNEKSRANGEIFGKIFFRNGSLKS